jgi:hypothetical protein
MCLGAWGAIMPFVGPAFHFGYGGTQTWAWTAARFWLQVLPGCAAFLGGLMMLVSGNRLTAMIGCWLAILAGTWFIIGPTLAGPWHLGDLGHPMGGPGRAALTTLVLFLGLGAAILYLASLAAGRLTVRSLRDIEHAQMHHRLRREAGGGLLGGLTGGGARRHEEPTPVRDRGRDEYRAEGEEGRAHPRDERITQVQPPPLIENEEVYPRDDLRLHPLDRAEERPARREHPRVVERVEPVPVRGEQPVSTGPSQQAEADQQVRHVVTPTEHTVYPSDTARAGGARSTTTTRGRHEAQSGLADKLENLHIGEKLEHLEHQLSRTFAKIGSHSH